MKCLVYVFRKEHATNNNMGERKNRGHSKYSCFIEGFYSTSSLAEKSCVLLTTPQPETLHVWLISGSNENITNTQKAKNIEKKEVQSNSCTCVHVHIMFIHKRISVFKGSLQLPLCFSKLHAIKASV
jgi:hypothetical protein